MGKLAAPVRADKEMMFTNRQLVALIDDFSNYDAPVMLPNGDILIRRNAPLVTPTEPTPGPNGEIEL